MKRILISFVFAIAFCSCSVKLNSVVFHTLDADGEWNGEVIPILNDSHVIDHQPATPVDVTIDNDFKVNGVIVHRAGKLAYTGRWNTKQDGSGDDFDPETARLLTDSCDVYAVYDGDRDTAVTFCTLTRKGVWKEERIFVTDRRLEKQPVSHQVTLANPFRIDGVQIYRDATLTPVGWNYNEDGSGESFNPRLKGIDSSFRVYAEYKIITKISVAMGDDAEPVAVFEIDTTDVATEQDVTYEKADGATARALKAVSDFSLVEGDELKLEFDGNGKLVLKKNASDTWKVCFFAGDQQISKVDVIGDSPDAVKASVRKI